MKQNKIKDEEYKMKEFERKKCLKSWLVDSHLKSLCFSLFNLASGDQQSTICYFFFNKKQTTLSKWIVNVVNWFDINA